MINSDYINFLESRDAGYVWQFTKQETDFEKIFLAAKLFNEWKEGSQSLSPEEFFSVSSSKYGITDRHRTLIIAQFYGLITKNSSQYQHEEITNIFKELSTCQSINTYKNLITEQLLKIKLPAITYSRHSDSEITRHIFPIIFIYQVLKELKLYHINSITIDELYTYVMTANFHSDLENVVNFLKQPIKPIVNRNLLQKYKDRSRIVPLLKNINLFEMNDNNISINLLYVTVMDSFLNNNLSKFLSKDLINVSVYKDFLYNPQNFNINLINEEREFIFSDTNEDAKEDVEYIENVNSNELNLFEPQVKSLLDEQPKIISSGEKFVVKRDANIGCLAIINSEYKCENDINHNTFISKRTKKPYMEAHHLIPISQAQYMWNRKHKNIDCLENIVSLCPTCHRAIHHGEFDVKLAILKHLYDIRIDKLKDAGIYLSFEDLLKFYL